MTLPEIITLIIAIYGAGLSTFIAIKALQKERRKISITLEHILRYENIQISITNSGHRPVKLSGLSIETMIGDEHNGHWENVPMDVIIESGISDDVFPVMIKEGDSVVFPLSRILTGYLLENKMQAKIIIYDVEGNQYSDFHIRTYDSKWGTYHKE